MKWIVVLIIGLTIASCCIERPKVLCYYADGTLITDSTHLNLIYRKLPNLLSQERIDSADIKIYTSLESGLTDVLTKEITRLQDTIYPHVKWEHRETKTLMDSLKAINQFLNVSVVAIDNKTGQVVVHYSNRSKSSADFVTNRGPIGGMNKTLLYTLAMQKEFTPYDRYPQMRRDFNSDFYNMVPDSTINRSFLRAFSISFGGDPSRGLAEQYSDKQAYAFLLMLLREGHIENYSSLLFLFDAQLSLLDLTKTWSAFYNKGIRNEPTVINRIVNFKGKELYRRKAHSTRILDEQTAEEMLHLLDYYSHLGRGTVVHRKFPNSPDFIGNFGGLGSGNSGGYFIAITGDFTIGIRCITNDWRIRLRGGDYNQEKIPLTVPFWLKCIENLRKSRPNKSDELKPLYKYRTFIQEEKVPEIEI
ncbi:MAG: hypothetical protein V4604_17470 [Bacteroidota bacterium]